MSDKDFNFQKELRKSILEADPKLDRNELLVDIFKYWVSKLFEYILKTKDQTRIEFEAMIQIKRNVINEFRKTELSEYQLSIKKYEELFESTIKEIFEFASTKHAGKDSVKIEQTLSIDPKMYINEGGLFVPERLKN